MARYFRHILTAAALALTACQEGGEAGDLFGQWRMTGSDTQYISFSGSVVLLRDLSAGLVYGNFQHSGDSLFIQCYSIGSDPADTLIVEEHYGWKPFNDIRLKIDAINDDNLVVSKADRTWSFRKY